MINMKKILLALLLVVFVIGCARAPEVQKKVAEKDFQQVSAPATPEAKQEEVGKTLANVSKSLDELSDLTKDLES